MAEKTPLRIYLHFLTRYSVFVHPCWFPNLAVGTRVHTDLFDLHNTPQMFRSGDVADLIQTSNGAQTL